MSWSMKETSLVFKLADDLLHCSQHHDIWETENKGLQCTFYSNFSAMARHLESSQSNALKTRSPVLLLVKKRYTVHCLFTFETDRNFKWRHKICHHRNISMSQFRQKFFVRQNSRKWDENLFPYFLCCTFLVRRNDGCNLVYIWVFPIIIHCHCPVLNAIIQYFYFFFFEGLKFSPYVSVV